MSADESELRFPTPQQRLEDTVAQRAAMSEVSPDSTDRVELFDKVLDFSVKQVSAKLKELWGVDASTHIPLAFMNEAEVYRYNVGVSNKFRMLWMGIPRRMKRSEFIRMLTDGRTLAMVNSTKGRAGNERVAMNASWVGIAGFEERRVQQQRTSLFNRVTGFFRRPG